MKNVLAIAGAIIVFALAFTTLSLTGCAGDVPDPSGDLSGITTKGKKSGDITYSVIQIGGTNQVADSTGIKFTFSKSIDGLNLTAANITVGERAAKGANATFTGSGTTWTLEPITVTHAGQATVTITKAGFNAETNHVTVHKEDEAALTGITATYTGTAPIYPTTELDDLKADLTVMAQYSDDSEEELLAQEYALSISGGGTLTVGTNTVTVSYEDETDDFDVTVSKITPVVAWPQGLSAVRGQTLSDISLDSYTNSDGTPGAFSWTTPDDSVDELGTQSHNMTFTPTEASTYDTDSQDVDVLVSLVAVVRVKSGTFMMSSPSTETGRNANEGTDPFEVTLTKDFYIGTYEVTQKQWYDVMGKTQQEVQQAAIAFDTANYGRGDNYPIYFVSWYDALVFCNKLSMMEGLTPAYSINNSTDPADWDTVPTTINATWNINTIEAGSTGYRLPTEAQWEYAARGGHLADEYMMFSGSNTVTDVAWYQSNNTPNATKSVGTKAANELGIYDMSGNVYEWCWESGGGTYADVDDLEDPEFWGTSTFRQIRGGNWNSPVAQVRSAARSTVSPITRQQLYGFRLVRPAE